jgi:formylglycine-generating enzyme required for sulfatase activity
LPYGGGYDQNTCNGTDSGTGAVVDVGSLTSCVTTAGVKDLSGNVWEWENSCSGETGANDNCRVRGGAFNAAAALMECAADLLQQRQMRNPALGFRCCADAEL